MQQVKCVFDLIDIADNPAKHKPKADLALFTHVRAYHLCRPRDIKSYKTHGIRLFSREELEKEFRLIFAHISPQYLDEAIERFGPPRLPPEIFAGLDSRFLLECCGDYALYGSETIKGFAANIRTPDETDHFQVLTNIGTPTVLVLEIPIAELSQRFTKELDENLQLLESGRSSEVYQIGTTIDCAMSLQKPVPPEWIVSYYTPTRDAQRTSRFFSKDVVNP